MGLFEIGTPHAHAHTHFSFSFFSFFLCISIRIFANNLLQTAQLKRTNQWAFLKSAADNWRTKKCHVFSQGKWNEGLQKFVPSSSIAQYFFLRLIRSRFEGRRFLVLSLNDIHRVPTDDEFEELKDFFLEHVDLIDGAETLRRLVFFADSGFDQASMDRRFSNLGADEIGHEWVLDGEGWNRCVVLIMYDFSSSVIA